MFNKDNPAFHEAAKSNQPVVALFVVAPGEWKRHKLSGLKVDFILRSVKALQQDLAKLNVPLIVRTAAKFADVQNVVSDVVEKLQPSNVYWNEEYEVNESRRDLALKDKFTAMGIRVFTGMSQLIVEPGLITTAEGKTYKVFTPYKNSWIRVVQSNAKLLQLLPVPATIQDSLPHSISEYIKANSDVPDTISGDEFFVVDEEVLKTARLDFPAGEAEARSKLNNFISQRGRDYKQNRDFPGKHGTSKLSTYFAVGAISPREAVALAKSANNNRLDSGNEGLDVWISEVIWREFYRNILIFFPQVCMNRAFKPDTDAVEWNYDKELFQKWCEGKTGFPIVDAAMRQLNTTGWMHNRLRMIVAMFLTKDLLIDWRWGEEYFMKKQIDGDFASNNGGWQWASSTGTDSQPYFRVFNPLNQSQKFDPDGSFIRKFVPELASLKAPAVHDPFKNLAKDAFAKLKYPVPIVDHSAARKRCIDAFKKAAGKAI